MREELISEVVTRIVTRAQKPPGCVETGHGHALPTNGLGHVDPHTGPLSDGGVEVDVSQDVEALPGRQEDWPGLDVDVGQVQRSLGFLTEPVLQVLILLGGNSLTRQEEEEEKERYHE